jgi:pantoate--beta-alanine ligase
MEVTNAIIDCRVAVEAARRAGNRVALVPTMGALHEGHLSLVDEARSRAECVVLSVFVNPLQFSPGEDYERYPRDLTADAAIAEKRGVGVLFAPSVEEMYPRATGVTVKAGRLAGEWEGRVRPGHFDGVLTVVTKLFHIVAPDVTVFGQKDLQQATLVGALIRDLDMPIEFVIRPTVRDADGLALSSRNRNLSVDDRTKALALSRALRAIELEYDEGERDVEVLERAGRAVLAAAAGIKVDYLAVVDRETFVRPSRLAAGGAAIGAIRVRNTRLIDNVLLG